jgi:Arm DNA-binding domain
MFSVIGVQCPVGLCVVFIPQQWDPTRVGRGVLVMRGSVVKKNDRWYVVIEDRDPATGERKRRWHSGFRTKRDAQAACNELRLRCSAATTCSRVG